MKVKLDNVLSGKVTAPLLSTMCWVLWGLVFPVIKKGYSLFGIRGIGSTFRFAGYRFLFAGIILLLLAAVKERKLPLLPWRKLLPLVLLGTVQTGIVYALEFAAMIRASSVNCSIINGSQVMSFTVIAHFMYQDERMTVKKVAGALLGFIGVVFCFLYGGEVASFSFLGEGLMLIATTTFALGSNMSRRIVSDTNPTIATGYNLLTGGVELYLLSLFFHGHMENGGILGWTMILYLALTSSLCLLVWTALIKANGIGKVAIYQCANPITGAVASSLMLGEQVFQTKYVVAVLLICIGIYVINTSSQGKAQK